MLAFSNRSDEWSWSAIQPRPVQSALRIGLMCAQSQSLPRLPRMRSIVDLHDTSDRLDQSENDRQEND